MENDEIPDNKVTNSENSTIIRNITPSKPKKPKPADEDASPVKVAVIATIGTVIVALVTGFTSVASSSISLISPTVLLIIGVIILILLIASIAGAVTYLVRDANRQSQKAREKIALVESKVETQPEKARPAWDLARVTLDAYFNRNLAQITYIFWFSVFVMVVGFAVIIWGISQAVKTPTVIMPATITVMAGVITEFIGATFVFIYRSTLQQALNYTKALERINSVGMAMQILDTIPDVSNSKDLKSKTKASLVELLVKQSNEVSLSSDIKESKT